MGRTSRLATAGLLAASATAFPRGPIPIQKRQNETGTVGTTHDDLEKPSLLIDWQPCHEDTAENLQCTWLTVPLDYENLDAGSADIAFIRYLLDENVEDLIYNPGKGPSSILKFLVNNQQRRPWRVGRRYRP